jgi:hypothetical protein
MEQVNPPGNQIQGVVYGIDNDTAGGTVKRGHMTNYHQDYSKSFQNGIVIVLFLNHESGLRFL